MTNLVAAAYLATNVLLNCGPVSCGVLTNLTGRYARYFDVRDACVVERAITCPACGNVSTQQVDITDIYDHYQALRQSDIRIGTLLSQVAGGACRDAERTVVELKAEVARLKDELLQVATRQVKEAYVCGYTNAMAAAGVRCPTTHGAVRILLSRREVGLLETIAREIDRTALGVAERRYADDQD